MFEKNEMITIEQAPKGGWRFSVVNQKQQFLACKKQMNIENIVE